jgi:hypothetical protein
MFRGKYQWRSEQIADEAEQAVCRQWHCGPQYDKGVNLHWTEKQAKCYLVTGRKLSPDSSVLRARETCTRTWEDNIKMGLKEIWCEGADWIQLAQGRVQWRALVDTVMNIRVPQKTWNFLTSWVTTSVSRRTLFHNSKSIESLDTWVRRGERTEQELQQVLRDAT